MAEQFQSAKEAKDFYRRRLWALKKAQEYAADSDDEMKGRYYGRGQDAMDKDGNVVKGRGDHDHIDSGTGEVSEERETPQERRRRIVGG